MRNESASNCSNSHISAPNNLPCTCTTHTKPKEYGNFLTPTYVSEFQRSNTPCECECEKCRKVNRRLLNTDKIAFANKRILKSLRRIQQRGEAIQGLGLSNGAGEEAKEGSMNSLTKIDNLCALKLVLLSDDDFISSQRKSFDKVSN